MKKNILGLDLGTNSIGWAIVSYDKDSDSKPEIKLGSRIIPMSQDTLGKFDSGVTESPTADRTSYRGTRRLRERCLLRRERMFRVLHTSGMLPKHFDYALGWDKSCNKTFGKFIDQSQPKIAWYKDENGVMQFLFKSSFDEMINDFAANQPELVKDGKKVPYDWTLYYLRKKALTHPISAEELAWILLSFNQKRGYYQLRGEEEEEKEDKLVEYYELKVVSVEDSGEKKGSDTWYNVTLENGWIYRRASRVSLDNWVGLTKEFIVTTQLEADGSIKLDKDGNPRRSFRAPLPDDWTLQKKRIESSIASSGKTVGTYIYDSILSMPSEKVRGKLVRTIERKFYKQELKAILEKQAEFIPQLTDKTLYNKCIVELYSQNAEHRRILQNKNLAHLFVEDILFYQRPLKSKKSLISDCPYEKYEYVDKNTGEIKIQGIKCIAKSNPFYQEFRLWQFVQNLRLYNVENIREEEVTQDYLKSEEDYVRLFVYLNDRKEISQDSLLKDFFDLKKPKGKGGKYPLRWNYVEDKTYPCNETRHLLLSNFKKADADTDLLSRHEVEYSLWHLLYSVEDKQELKSALTKFAYKNNLGDKFVEVFCNIPSLKKEYGAYSEKAIKKLLTVMRMGSRWKAETIPSSANKVFDGSLDEKIQKRIGNYSKPLNGIDDLKGLPEWAACYAIYGRHSEVSSIEKWEKPESLRAFINGFKQYSLRNPIVEQCVLETLRTVCDIWKQYGHIDEIHIELGRSMKSTSQQRARMSAQNIQNENTNLRIKQLLLEMKNDSTIQDVRPYSPMQQEILKIYEEGALMELNIEDAEDKEIQRISRLATPTHSELVKYKLWLEQKYRSPYTGRTISLSSLFTPAYQIEHVIPQSRFFDDSLSNKVICEAEVNLRKSNMLGMEFIKKCGGEKIGNIRVFTEDEYTRFISEHYKNNRNKANKLLMEDIPEQFIQRQMNDSRYISKVIMGLLSNVVRAEGEHEATSKNVIACTGGITDRLKKDWGLNDIWNDIVSSRFERMNRLTNSEDYGHWENKEGKRVFQTTMPIELQKGFSKKRIDHRHHAMDALVIALASRNIVNYLNNQSANDTNRREDLRQLLCDKNRVIRKPWPTITQDTRNALNDIIISFKHYVRVLNKATNSYEHYTDAGKKVRIKQNSENLWAVRKPLHKETIFGRVNLQRKKDVTFSNALKDISNIVDRELRLSIQGMLKAGMDAKKINSHFKTENYMFAGRSVAKVQIYYYTDNEIPMVATRKPLDDSFDIRKILSITDTGIQQILLRYLEAKGGDPKIAFSPEGIVEMNNHIADFNKGREHKTIIRVRVSETMGEKHAIGENGVNAKKYAEAQSGTNLFFAIYENTEGKRSYSTIPFAIVAERLKQGLGPVPEVNEKGDILKYSISPNDLVYVPKTDEIIEGVVYLSKDRIYKLVSSTGSSAYFVRNDIATVIANKVELESLNKMEKTMPMDGTEPEMIKAVCWKLEVDRLGNVTKIIK